MNSKVILIALMLLLPVSLLADNGQWKPAGERIRTQWAEQVSPANAHPEYPRPQMVRGN